MFGPGLLPRPMPGSATLLQSWSVLMFLSLVTAKGQNVKVVHIWPRLLLAAALGRIDRDLTSCSTQESCPCSLLGQENPTDHVRGGRHELSLKRGIVGELALFPLPAGWWNA